MKKETDLESIKFIAKSFVYIPIEKTEVYPAAIIHPVFETPFVVLRKDDDFKFVNVVEDEASFKEVQKEFCERVDSCDNAISVYTMIRKSYRLTFIKFIEKYLSINDLSVLMADAWVSSENPNQDANVSTALAARLFKKCDKDILMTIEDKRVYDALEDEFIVYRGVAVGRNPKGLSWTCNLKTATWFAHRFDNGDSKGYLQCATAHKKDVLAYFNTRNEDEIVISTKSLNDIKIYEGEQSNGKIL